MFVALQSMLLFIVKGIVLIWNKISYVVAIREHVPHFLSLHFVTFVSFGSTCLVICAFSE